MDYKSQIEAQANHLIIFRPDVQFKIKLSSKYFICLNVSQDFLIDYLELNGGKFITQGCKNQCNDYSTVSCNNSSTIWNIMEVIKNTELNYQQKKYIIFFILSIFPLDVDFISFLTFFINGVGFKIRMIAKNEISKKWSLVKMAQLLYMSPGTLKKRLSNENTSYTKILLDCRMQKAAELLTIHNKNVFQTADYCGYKSVSFFITIFKKYYGTSPLLFVKRYISDNIN